MNDNVNDDVNDNFALHVNIDVDDNADGDDKFLIQNDGHI